MATTSNPDSDWKPNNRPQSTIALNFSHDLDNTFGMSNTDAGIDGLARAVEEKKQTISTQSAELEALNARIKATEDRLQQKHSSSSSSSPSSSSKPATAGANSTPKKTFSPTGNTRTNTASSDGNRPAPQSPPTNPSPSPASPQSSRSQGPLSSSTMNYWRGQAAAAAGRGGTGGGDRSAPGTPSATMRDMPGGFEQ